MIECVLFDLDGVLIDAVSLHEAAFINAVSRYSNHNISHEFHDSELNGLPTKKKLEKLVTMNIITKKDINFIYKAKQDETIVLINQKILLDEEKIFMLKALQDIGMSTGCVTNSIRTTTMLMLERSGLLPYLDCIVTNEDVQNPKPSPDSYKLAMRKLQASTSKTLIIEDSPVGVVAAKSSGANVLVVSGPEDVILSRILSQC